MTSWLKNQKVMCRKELTGLTAIRQVLLKRLAFVWHLVSWISGGILPP